MKFTKTRINKILNILAELYPDAKAELNYKNPLEMLVSTILSAQCTDKRVNMVTENLYKKYTSVKDFANADINELEEDIKPTGFFRNKAKHIKNATIMILKDYDGEVPNTIDELVKLPGVGRKTANVVLANSFGEETITVDTHLKRVSTRLGLTKEKDPVKIEFDLVEKLPKNELSNYSIRVIFHGRRVCHSRKANCDICKLQEYCEYFINKK